MSRFEFETLMRYVDGDLDDDECADIEAWLPSDPAARDIVADLRAQRTDLMREIHSHPYNEPRWETLAAIDHAFAERRRDHSRRDVMRRWALPMAASVMMAMIGSLVGYMIAARHIDVAVDEVIAAYARDEAHIAEALTKALEHHSSGSAAAWTNPHSGTLGSIKPLRTLRAAGGQWCREFKREVQSKTGDNKTTGIACRDVDGTWRLVHERPRDI